MASKKITELPLITAISSSVGYGQYDYRSVIPVVVGGSTNQITVEDFSIYAVRHSATTQSNTFLGNQTITGNISVSGTSTLTGNTSVGGTLGVTGNTSLSGDASVGGNLVVAGRITAEEFHTEITTASVIYASGSTKFGDTIDDKHEITGSTQISGSFTLNGGVILNGITFDISQLNAYTQSLKNEVGTIEAYTASVKETISQTLTYTQSLKETISQTLAYTGSVKETISQTLAYTASVKTQLSGIEAYTASLKGAVLPNGTNLDVFGNLRVSGSTYFGDNASDSTIITGKVEVTGSVSSTGGNTADFIQLSLTPSGIGGTGKLIWDSTIGGVSVGGKVSATEFIGAFQSTNGVVSASAQITELPSIQQATASLAAFTGSIRTELGFVEAYTASVKETISQTLAYTASVKSEIGNIESYTASLKETITQTLAYTASVKNEVGGLEAFTASIRTELGNVEAYTASVKETISQTLAYTASVKAEIGDIESYTASLKSAVQVSGTNATILGSLTINQNLNVLGSASIQYITSSQLNIFDNIISVNTYTPAVRFGGLAVIDSGSNPQASGSILFDSQENQWIFVHQNAGVVTSSLLLMGPETYNSVGNETHPTTNRILKSVNDEHLGDSNITDDGTNVKINSNSQITGSLNVSSNIVGGANIQANKFVFTDGVVSETTTAQKVIGTSGNILYLYTGASGLYINNQANNAQNVTITDAGVVTTRGGVQIGSSGNDQSLTFGGTNSSIYWGVGGPARMYYNVGDIKISSAGASDVLTVQNIGGVSVSGGITGSLLSTNGVVSGSSQITELTQIPPILAYTASLKTSGIVSSSQQIQNYNTFALTGASNSFNGTQTITGSILVSGSIIPNVGVGSYTSSFSLGSSTNAWGDIWVGNGSVKFVNPSSGATASIALDANNQLSLQNSSFTQGLKVTGSANVAGSVAITGSLIVTGSISSTETISMPSPFMFRNKIINGAMMIDQRNGGSAITTSDGFAVDRFHHYEDGADFTVQRSTLVPSGSGFINSLSITNGTGVSMASGNYTTLRHGIEGFNIADLNWGTSFAKNITISFWVRSSLTGTFGLALRNNANDYGYVVSYSIPSANTWVYITKTITGPTSGVWDTSNNNGIKLIWDLGAGTTYSIAAGTWTSASEILGLTGGTKFRTTTGATFYLTGVQLEVGNVATTFEHRNYSVELQLCKRYFQKWGSGVMWQAGNTGSSGGANDYFKMLGGGVYSGGEMRTTPDVTYLNDVYFMGIGGLSGSPSDLGTIAAANMGSLALSNSTVAMNRLGIFNITTYGGTRGWYYAATDPFVGLSAEIS